MTDAEIRSQTFSLNGADYARFYLFTYFRLFIDFPQAIIFWLVLVGAPILWAVESVSHGDYIGAAWRLGLFVGLWLIVIPLFSLWGLRRTLAKTANAYLPRVAVASPQQLSIEGEGFSDRRAWGQFRRVVARRKMIYLFVNASSAILVPRASFSSPEAAEAFIASSTTWVRESAHRQIAVFSDEIRPAAVQGSDVASPEFRMTFTTFFPLATEQIWRGLFRPVVLLILVGGMVVWPSWLNHNQIATGHFGALWNGFWTLGIFLALFPPAGAVLTWLFKHKQPMLSAPRRIFLSDEGVSARSDSFDIRQNWSAIRGITCRFKVIRFQLANSNSFALPLAAFASVAEAQVFRAQAEAYWRASKAA